MRKLVAIFAVVVLVFMLAACGKTAETITLYDANNITVTRQGAKITVSDNDSGKEYHFTTRHVKSRSEAAKQAQNAVDDGSLHIESAFNILRIAFYDGQGAIYIRVGR